MSHNVLYPRSRKSYRHRRSKLVTSTDSLSTLKRGDVRVVRIIARLNVGGSARHVLEITRGTAACHPTVLIIGGVDADEAELPDALDVGAAHVYRVPELGRRLHFAQDVVALYKITRLLQRLRPDIVDTHTAKAGVIGRIAAVLARVPIRLHTFHGHVFHGYFDPRLARLIVLAERLLARFTTRVITLSDTLKFELAERYRICSREKIQVIPLGFELAPLANADRSSRGAAFRAEVGARPTDTIVTNVGRLAPIKNHDLLLQTAACLADTDRQVIFALVGDGSEAGRLKERAQELGVQDRVRFLGWRHDLDRVYAGSDIVALTSFNEGTPVCLIEALAAGVPVVATDVGGVRDVLRGGELGLLVPSNDAPATASAIRRLMEDPDMQRRFAAAGRSYALTRYSLERLLSDVSALYSSLLTARGLSAATVLFAFNGSGV